MIADIYIALNTCQAPLYHMNTSLVPPNNNPLTILITIPILQMKKIEAQRY